jgi:hypothetical protein
MVKWMTMLQKLGTLSSDDSSTFSKLSASEHSNQKRLKRLRIISPDPSDHPFSRAHIHSDPAATAVVRKARNPNHVQFTNVNVRTYELILGDNPFVEYPLSLGWKYTTSEAIPVDAFDKRHQLEITPDYAGAQKLKPLSGLERRRHRLLRVGYDDKMLRREERRRRIQLAQEWAYRNDRSEAVVCSCPNPMVFLKRYILDSAGNDTQSLRFTDSFRL